MKAYNRQEGFTLIELLVVIAILGILAAVVIPAVTNFIGEGDEEAGETELHNVSLSVASLMADPSTPIHSLANEADGGDPRILDDGVVLCDARIDGADEDARKADPADIGVGAGTNATNDLAVLIQLDDTINGVAGGLYVDDNEAEPLTEYSQKDETENWYCVEEDGTTHGWLASDGTYIEDL